jgi:Zn-dependent peptidase ImmA (M78 family)/transcriptional regulator with XRE-family HTH domain
MGISAEELGRRLREARERVGLTQEEVARELGISRTAVALFEAGKRKVSGLELARLAFLYGRTPGDFFAQDLTGDGVAVLLRALPATETAEDIRDGIRRGMALAREVLNLEELLEVERAPTACPCYKVPVPRSSSEALEQGNLLAHQERRRLDLGSAPVPDIGEVLERQRVVVLELRLPDSLSGFTVRFEGERGVAVAVNLAHSAERRRFSLAHEYCHVLADHDLPGVVSREEEEERDLREVRANAFAAAFLMPEDGIRDYLARLRKGAPSRPREAVLSPGGQVRQVEGRFPPHARDIGIWHVCRLSAHFRVSCEAMIWRLYNLRLISGPDKDLLQEAQSRPPARTLARLLQTELATSRDGVQDRPSRLPRRVLELALDALHRELISRRKCLELLELAGVPREEAQELLGENYNA